jgi:NAD(P)-dependent dehydrogenase (short-subunit alcohol dehydrogenase family)
LGAQTAKETSVSDDKTALSGLAALVTGGGSGIGLACARHLLRDGAHVTIVGRSEDKLRAAAAELAPHARGGATVQLATCDVTSEDAVIAAVALAARPTGKLDIAVANAGAGAGGPIFSTGLDMWRYTVDVNLTGTFLTVKHAGQAMAAHGGSIVAISSIAGPLTHRYMAPYCASKAGVEMLIKVAADELGGLGIRANAVRPGLVPTDMAMPLTDDTSVVDDYLDQMPIKRLGTVEDIAAGVRYLAGPESSWVTGQCFAIDGGHTLRRGPRIDSMIERFYGPDSLRGLSER